MRQALDSEIIRFSMWIREGKDIKNFPAKNEQVMLIHPNEVVLEMYDWADQILCSTNNSRQYINSLVRQHRGFGPNPQVGDKIISLRNHWDFSSVQCSPLTNGSIGTIQSIQRSCLFPPYWICNKPIPILYTNFLTDDDNEVFERVCIDYTALTTGKLFLSGDQEYKMLRAKKCPQPPFEFAYAYAITVWKAQGSEWDKVLGYEEAFPYDKDTHQRCAYTLATRASKKLVYVMQDTKT